MGSKKRVDPNLPKNKKYIEKFYKKSEEEIKKQRSFGMPSMATPRTSLPF